MLLKGPRPIRHVKKEATASGTDQRQSGLARTALEDRFAAVAINIIGEMTKMALNKQFIPLLAVALLLSAGSAVANEPNEKAAGPQTEHPATEHQEDGHAGMQMESMPATSGASSREEASMGHMHDDSPVGKTFLQRLFNWLGRLHPMVIHFPIAMIIGAMGVELFGLWRRDASYQRAAGVMLVVGAIGAIVAAGLGWFAGGWQFVDRNPVLTAHRWTGTSIAVLASILVYMAFARHRHQGRFRAAYWLLLAGLTVAISIQGWLGGSFMHGGMRHLAF